MPLAPLIFLLLAFIFFQFTKIKRFVFYYYNMFYSFSTITLNLFVCLFFSRLKAISSNENYSQEEGTFLNSLYTAPRSLLQIKNENIRKRANKVKFARAPLSEDHIDYSAFNTAWQNESGQHLDRLLTIDGVVNSVVHFLDQIADYTEGMINHVIQFIFIFYFIFQSIFDVNALTLYSIKESYFPNKRQKRLLTIDDSDELFYFSKDKLPISPDHLLDDVKDLNSNDILFKNELIPSVEDNIKAGNITEDYYSSTLDSSASYRGNRYFKDWCKMSNDVGETDLEELGLHQISHYAESEEEFDKEYYMIKKLVQMLIHFCFLQIVLDIQIFTFHRLCKYYLQTKREK